MAKEKKLRTFRYRWEHLTGPEELPAGVEPVRWLLTYIRTPEGRRVGLQALFAMLLAPAFTGDRRLHRDARVAIYRLAEGVTWEARRCMVVGPGGMTLEQWRLNLELAHKDVADIPVVLGDPPVLPWC